MRTTPLFAGLFVAILLGAPVLAAAQPVSGSAGAGGKRSPIGMTGHYRGWSSQRGSGSGANYFVGNGRGQPERGAQSRGHAGGWFANSHDGQRNGG